MDTAYHNQNTVGEVTRIDELVRRTNLPIQVVSAALVVMELYGIVQQVGKFNPTVVEWVNWSTGETTPQVLAQRLARCERQDLAFSKSSMPESFMLAGRV